MTFDTRRLRKASPIPAMVLSLALGVVSAAQPASATDPVVYHSPLQDGARCPTPPTDPPMHPWECILLGVADEEVHLFIDTTSVVFGLDLLIEMQGGGTLTDFSENPEAGVVVQSPDLPFPAGTTRMRLTVRMASDPNPAGPLYLGTLDVSNAVIG